MKKLIVCCDGTWNSPEQEEYELPAPTNVVRLYNCLARVDDNQVQQRKYYHSGVGTEGGFLSRTAGGMYGKGLSQNIMSAYAWLGRNYDDGDLIYLFGFSRGAYTARSLAGMLRHCGIVDLRAAADPFKSDALAPSEAWTRVAEAYEAYRKRPKGSRDPWQTALPRSAQPGVPIQFVGVWETVGALGIPDDRGILNLLDQPQNWLFHDTELSAETRYARHALAMDEMRSSFTPTLWMKDGEVQHDPIPAGGTGKVARVRQIYFPGVHSDVGGGYYVCGLADGALRWMIDEVQGLPDGGGLAFVPAMVNQIKPDPQAPLHDSYRGMFKFLHSRPRNVPPFYKTDRFHASTLARVASAPLSQGPYRPRAGAPSADPGNLDRILSVGDFEDCEIYALHPWNPTGIYLEPGQYQFKAEGEWIDRSISSDPAGKTDGEFHLTELIRGIASVLSQLESAYRALSGNAKAELDYSKRIDDAPWFALIGVVTNDCDRKGALPPSPAGDGTPPAHQAFVIGKLHTETISRAGFLYAFANDAWPAYGNNRGSVTLRVTRLSQVSGDALQAVKPVPTPP